MAYLNEFKSLFNAPIVTLLGVGLMMFLVIGGLSMLAHFYTLNGIKSKTVGDGQHGVARFLTKKEIKKVYNQVPYDVARWRNGENLPTEQGLVVGSLSGTGDVTGLVDTGECVRKGVTTAQCCYERGRLENLL